MDGEKLTGQQHFHQRPLMGKGIYVQGPNQCSKAVAAFIAMPFLYKLERYLWLLITYTNRGSGTLPGVGQQTITNPPVIVFMGGFCWGLSAIVLNVVRSCCRIKLISLLKTINMLLLNFNSY